MHSATLRVTPMPPTQKNGVAHNTTSSGRRRNAPATLAPWRMTVPCVCTTPLGSAVVPDVWITTMRSDGVTSASTAARNSSETPSTSPVSSKSVEIAVAHGGSARRADVGDSRTERRYGASGRRSGRSVVAPARACDATPPIWWSDVTCSGVADAVRVGNTSSSIFGTSVVPRVSGITRVSTSP